MHCHPHSKKWIVKNAFFVVLLASNNFRLHNSQNPQWKNLCMVRIWAILRTGVCDG
jgi:hypothetical protein